MQNNLSQQPPPSPVNRETEIIADPWEKDRTNATKLTAEGWQAPVDIHPLICGEEKSEFLNLPESETSELSPIQVLLEDGLKIKPDDGGKLKEHLNKALGLLSWMVNIPSEYAN